MRNYLLFTLIFLTLKTYSQNNILESGINKLNLKGCSVVNAAIEITGTGNTNNNQATFSSQTTLDEIDINVELKVSTLNANGFFKFGIGKIAPLAGTLVEFSGTDKETKVTVSKLDNTISVFAAEFILPFSLTAGEIYNFRIGKRIRNLEIEVSSGFQHYLNDTLTYPTPFFGLLWGTPLIACHSGKVVISDFTITTPFNKNARLAVWGDSFVEGSSLPSEKERYSALLKDSVGFSNIAIMGRGGENSGSLESRFSKELEWFKKAKYAIVAIGANDGDFNYWKTNLLKYVGLLKKKGIVPILATIAPRYDRTSFIIQANNWIRNEYNGVYVDLNKGLSADGQTWTNGLYLPDYVHPNVAGHQVMFDKFKTESPFIFKELSEFSIDYINERTADDIDSRYEYSENSNFLNVKSGGNGKALVTPGSDLFFRIKPNTARSVYDIIPAPPRPVAPLVSSSTSSFTTFDWIYNPDFLNIGDYEYSADKTNWITCYEKPIKTTNSNLIELRLKATATSFKSEAVKLNDFQTFILNAPATVNIVLYPNPVDDILTISNIEEPTTLTIYSMDGRIIKMAFLLGNHPSININELLRGNYIVMIKNSITNQHFKIIKN